MSRYEQSPGGEGSAPGPEFATGGIVPRDGAYRLADRDVWHLRPTGSETTAEPGPRFADALAYLITTPMPQRGRWLGFRRLALNAPEDAP